MVSNTDGPEIVVPPLACDCHMHVFGPGEQYPPAASRGYTPTPAELPAYLAMADGLGLQRVVLVQPSAYGTDNTCMMDALRARGSAGRGVAVIDAATTDAELHAMAALGVRATRLNLVSNGAPDAADATAMLAAASHRVAPLGWHIQVFADLPLLAQLAPVFRGLPVPVVIDHMGHPRAAAGLQQPGFDALLRMLAEGLCWVKLSGANRVSAHATDYTDAGPIARALIAANGRRVVWGSDWPHIAPHPAATEGPPGPVHYRALDNHTLLHQLWSWAPVAAVQRILVDNPAELYGF